jgi:hypothetical protein
MTRISIALKALVAAATLAIVLASADTTWAAGREAAIHECSVRAGKFIEHGWAIRSCMCIGRAWPSTDSESERSWRPFRRPTGAAPDSL